MSIKGNEALFRFLAYCPKQWDFKILDWQKLFVRFFPYESSTVRRDMAGTGLDISSRFEILMTPQAIPELKRRMSLQRF